MGNETAMMSNRNEYKSVRTHRRNSSASLSMMNSLHLHDINSKRSEESNPDKMKRLNSTSSLYRQKNTMDQNGQITVGSYCYCDCDTYFVVVTEVMDNSAFKIVDLF